MNFGVKIMNRETKVRKEEGDFSFAKTKIISSDI